MKAAIIQSNFLPWKGYFDIIREVDVFVFEDDVQYTVHDWRNRNRIKTPGGLHWITVPVLGSISQRICDVRIDPARAWARKMAESIRHSYARTPFFDLYFQPVESMLKLGHERLIDLNYELLQWSCKILGITTRLVRSQELECQGTKDDKLISLCRKLGIDHYLSGPAAKAYIIPDKFERNAIKLEYKDYSGYPDYPQLYPPFEHGVSILDLLFHTGPKAPWYIWGWRESPSKENP